MALTRDSLRRFQNLSADSILYHGNLGRQEKQFKNSSNFVGLCLYPTHNREIAHDITRPLPIPENSIAGFQSQDVLEHLPYDLAIEALNEVYRCLKPGGFFRLSLPDYNSPLLLKRTVFDHKGNPIADLAMGGRVRVKDINSSIEVSFAGPPGFAHLWFPTYDLVKELINKSEIQNCTRIRYVHYWIDRNRYHMEELTRPIFHVTRRPPIDMRADGQPISIIVDFTK